MSETNHTPGPWNIIPPYPSHYGEDQAWIDAPRESTGYGRVVEVCRVEPDPGSDEQKANAKLIAAAPDLLDALKKAWWFIENVSAGDPDSSRTYFELREIVRDAFEKASIKEPSIRCPRCNSDAIQTVEWSAQSLDPTDKDNRCKLMEYQCVNDECGKSFWI